MRIEHLALWADDIELLRSFYMKFRSCSSVARYGKTTIPHWYSIYFSSLQQLYLL